MSDWRQDFEAWWRSHRDQATFCGNPNPRGIAKLAYRAGMQAFREHVEPRCPECGYTEADAKLHGDHHLCPGTIPAAN